MLVCYHIMYSVLCQWIPNFFLPRIPLACKSTSQGLLFDLFSLLIPLVLPSSSNPPPDAFSFHYYQDPTRRILISSFFPFLSEQTFPPTLLVFYHSSQPAQNIFSSWSFSAFSLRKRWGHSITKGFFLLLAFPFFCRKADTNSPFSILAKLDFLLSEMEIDGSGDRCCHSSLLVSSIYPWGGGSTLCHLWMHLCLCLQVFEI